MEITLQYFPQCPSWRGVDADLASLVEQDPDIRVTHQLVETPDAAEQAGFRGSPTVLIDGNDPFADADAPIGLSCRLYVTDNGVAGAPTRRQLADAMALGH